MCCVDSLVFYVICLYVSEQAHVCVYEHEYVHLCTRACMCVLRSEMGVGWPHLALFLSQVSLSESGLTFSSAGVEASQLQQSAPLVSPTIISELQFQRCVGPKSKLLFPTIVQHFKTLTHLSGPCYFSFFLLFFLFFLFQDRVTWCYPGLVSNSWVQGILL